MTTVITNRLVTFILVSGQWRNLFQLNTIDHIHAFNFAPGTNLRKIIFLQMSNFNFHPQWGVSLSMLI